MSGQAIYLSRVAAYKACIRHGRARGLTDEAIAQRCRAFPVMRQGELKGWTAWLPYTDDGTNNRMCITDAMEDHYMERAA